jgi:hypothetical protein
MKNTFAANVLLLLAICTPAFAQQQPGTKPARSSIEHLLPIAKPSPIPINEFADTLEEQEKQLAENAYLKRLHKARAAQAYGNALSSPRHGANRSNGNSKQAGVRGNFITCPHRS